MKRKDFFQLVMTLNADIENLDTDIEHFRDNEEMRLPYEMEREDCIMILTDTIKRYAIESELQQISIAYGLNDLAKVTMVGRSNGTTTVYIDWNDGNEDAYEYELPISRMVKINKDLRFNRIILR